MFRQIKKGKSLFSSFTPITIRRIENFKANKRGYFSLWIFLFVLFSTLFAEFIANDKPLLVKYKGELFFPVLISYPETDFGGEFDSETDYRDPFVDDLINEEGWILWLKIIHMTMLKYIIQSNYTFPLKLVSGGVVSNAMINQSEYWKI